MILCLDFDGVLHPADVYVRQGPAGLEPYLEGEGELFQWAPLLVDALAPYPDVKIVLSTTWAATAIGYEGSVARLPAALQWRVIGATANKMMPSRFYSSSRYQQIAYTVSSFASGGEWIAIDDDDWMWPERQRHHLVHVADAKQGLAGPGVLAQLAERLDWLASERGANK